MKLQLTLFKTYKLSANKLTKILLSFLLALIILNLLFISFAEINYSYPRENRDGALIDIAHQFATNSNPYTIINSVPHTYTYGFLSPLLDALFSKSFGLDLVLSQHLITFICMLLIGFIVSKEIFKGTRSISLVLVSLVIVLLYNNVSLRPESLAVLLTISILYFVRHNKVLDLKKNLILSLSVITLFYIKQYFALLFPVLIIYFIFNQPKKNLFYLITTTFMLGLASFIVISKTFPIYFAETIINHMNMTGGPSVWITHRWNYVIKQSTDFFNLNWLIVLLFVSAAIIGFVKNMIIKINVSDVNKPLLIFPTSPVGNVYFLYCFVAIFFLTFLLGYHGGTYLTYYFQLLPIPLYIFGICYSYTALQKYRLREPVFILIIILFIYENYIYLRLPAIDQRKERFAWENAITYISKKHQQQEVYLPAVFTTEAIKRGLSIYDNGQTEYYYANRLSESTHSTQRFSFLSPQDTYITSRLNGWQNELEYKTINKKFSLIVLPEGYHTMINEKYLIRYYRLKQKMKLPFNYGDLGGPLSPILSQSIEFWEPK